MKDKMDILLKSAYSEKIEPGKELNDELIERLMGSVNNKKIVPFSKKRAMNAFAKAAVIAICAMSIGTIGVYAGSKAIKKMITKNTSVQEHGMVITNATEENESNVPVIDLDKEYKDYNDTKDDYNYMDDFCGEKTGGVNDNWKTRKLFSPNVNYMNVQYAYDDYSKALEDSGFSKLFSKDYEVGDDGIVYTDTFCKDDENEVDRSLDAFFKYKKGKFSVIESYHNNVAPEVSNSVITNSIENARKYTNKNGVEFALADDINSEGQKYTLTMFMSKNNMYSGILDFIGLSDEEIHEILDTIVIPDGELQIVNREKMDDVVKEIEKYKEEHKK